MIDNKLLIQLSEIYSKTNLEKGILPYVINFYANHYSKVDNDPALESIFQRLVNKKPLNKIDLAQLCFSVFENEIIYKEFLSTLPQSLQILIEKLLWVEEMLDTEAEKILNEPVTKPSKYLYSSREKEVKNEFYFFSVYSQYIYSYPPKTIITFSIHPLLKQVLINFYPKPINYYFKPIDKIPETNYRFTAEGLILQEMPRLLSYYMQGRIKYSIKGKPSEATLNRLRKTCGIAEFFPAEDELTCNIRSMLLAGLLYNFRASNITIDTVSVIKELFTKRYFLIHTSQFILSRLKGWGMVNESDFDENTEPVFLKILKQLPAGKWISTKNLIEFIDCRSIQVKPLKSYALNNHLYFEKEKVEKYGIWKEKKQAGNNAMPLVNIPFIKGTIFLFASFGLIETAFAKVNTEEFGKTYYSGYDGLQYFRLTALGAYVLGLSESYQPAQAQQKNKLQFSEDSLMILAEGDMGVLDIMLSNFAEKAGNNRFNVTHAHFLKDCRNKKDIETKFALFKKIISEKLPAYWEQQFIIWQENALKIKKDYQVHVFKIPPDAKELQRLIAQDSVIKTLILKAERFHILVPTDNVIKFKNRMKELGYLVE